MIKKKSSDNQVEYIPRDGQQEVARPDEVLPDTLQLIPLGERPYFPVLVQPIVVNADPWGSGLEEVGATAHKLLALSYAPSGKSQYSPDDICSVGCVVRLHRIQQDKDKVQFIAQGIRRFRIREWIKKKPPYRVRVEYVEAAPVADDSQVRAYAMALINIIKELMTLNPLYNEELKHYLNHFNANEPSALADFAAAITSAESDDLQDILER